jgi:hypothetical protein
MSIPIPNDELIPDAELASRWGITTRTLARYTSIPDGLPFWIVGGKKYRAARASSEWLAARVQRPNQRRGRKAA